MVQSLKISIVTVCYNSEDSIEKTIKSVISQDYPNVEYVIIDGGSTDGTLEIINKYKCNITKVISERDKGIYNAMNKGIKLCTGDFINFMNAGDVFHNISTLSDVALLLNKNYDIIYGCINKHLPDCYYLYKPYPLKQMSYHMILPHQATFIKTSFHKAHLFDETFKSSGDYDFFYKAYFYHHAKFKEINIVVCDYEDYRGMSKDDYKRAKLEDLRIWGKQNNLFTLVKTYLWFIYRDTKRFIRKYVSEDTHKKMRDLQLRKQGFEIIYKKR